MDRVEIETSDLEVVRNKLSNILHGRVLSDEELKFLLLAVSERIVDTDECIRLPATTSGRSVFGARPLDGAYVVKTKVATIVSGALLLDYFATAGLTIGAMAAAGRDLRALVKLSEESGELCVFISLEQLSPSDFPATENYITERLERTHCYRSSDKRCAHHILDSATIDTARVRENLARLSRLNLIDRTSDGSVASIV